MDAAHAAGRFRVQHPIGLADFLVEVAGQVPPKVRRFVELMQRVRRVDAAADDFGVFLPEFVRV